MPVHLRLDCAPEPNASQASCELRGCCWTPVPPELSVSHAPWCHFPAPSVAYVADGLTFAAGGASATATLRRVAAGGGGAPGRGPFGQDPPLLSADLSFYAPGAFRLRVRDPGAPPRWSPPPSLPLTPGLAAVEGGGAPPPAADALRYGVALSAPAPAPFSLLVTRGRGEDAPMALEALGGDLLFEPQLVQFSVALPPGALVHGLGEAVAPWELGRLAASSAGTGGARTHTLWTRDRGTPDAGPNGNANLYGAHPFVLLRDAADGAATGLFLRSTAAMDVTLGPAAGGGTQALTFRVTGGEIDLFVFVGGGPSEVLADYHALVGLPALPPLWGLGFHVCRWGYPSLGAAAAVRAELNAAGFPLDTLWLDIDYMSAYRDFTLSEHFPEAEVRKWVDELHAEGQHFVVINDPGIASGYPPGEYAPFDDGAAAGVFIKAPEGSPDAYAIGGVWPGATAFADFSLPAAHSWWEAQVTTFHGKIGFDGLWLDMGEPSVFRDAVEEARARRAAAPSPPPPAPPPPPVPAGAAARGAKAPLIDFTWPPFLPGRRGGAAMLEEKTLPTAARTGAGEQYWVHSLFGLLEAAATAPVLRRLTGARQFIISRATWAGSGAWGGHWLGDNTATWHDLRMSLPGVFNFHVFGQPFVGTDLCGFAPAGASVGGHAGLGGEGALDDHGLDGELCARWYQMGALIYTFFRVHTMAGRPDQHPTAFSAVYRDAMLAAVQQRYALVPYLYTALAGASERGGVVVRPLSHDFFGPAAAGGRRGDAASVGARDAQAMVGAALLVSPVLSRGADTVRALLPCWERWYDWASGLEVPPGQFSFEGEGDAEEAAAAAAGEAGGLCGSWHTFPAPLAGAQPLHVRGGYVVPDRAAPTLRAALGEPAARALRLTVALGAPAPLAEGAEDVAGDGVRVGAAGELYWDNGGSLEDAGGATWLRLGAAASGRGALRGVLSVAAPGPAAGGGGASPPCVQAVRVLGVDAEAAPHCSAERRPRAEGGETEPLPCSWTDDGAVVITLPECAELLDGLQLTWRAGNNEEL